MVQYYGCKLISIAVILCNQKSSSRYIKDLEKLVPEDECLYQNHLCSLHISSDSSCDQTSTLIWCSPPDIKCTSSETLAFHAQDDVSPFPSVLETEQPGTRKTLAFQSNWLCLVFPDAIGLQHKLLRKSGSFPFKFWCHLSPNTLSNGQITTNAFLGCASVVFSNFNFLYFTLLCYCLLQHLRSEGGGMWRQAQKMAASDSFLQEVS